MYRVSMRSVIALLFGALIITFSVSAYAKKSKETKKIEKIVETPEEKQKRYEACVAESKHIENEYYLSLSPGQIGIARADLDADEYLFRDYLHTVKWDQHGCFAYKDLLAAKRVNMTLKQYVILGMHLELRSRLAGLFKHLKTEECAPGVKCKPGITSGFRDDYRQKIAEGFKAGDCNSNHGGSCRTKGWGDGQAIDVVHVSDFDVDEDGRFAATEKMWHHTDSYDQRSGLHRPMKGADPMHLEPTTSLTTHVVFAGERNIEKPVEKKPVVKNREKRKAIKKRRKRQSEDD